MLLPGLSQLRSRLAALPAGVQTWLADRGKAVDLFDESYADRRGNPLYILGGMIYFLWIVVIVSGLWLILYYVPTEAGAYASIERIQNELPLGWLLRGLHKYGADAVLIAVTIRIYRMYFRGEYKRSQELSWIFAILALILAMYSALTGYLLIWNQRAYWASKVMATMPTYLDETPGVGQLHLGWTSAHILLGGTFIGPGTITRFYALHFLFSLVALLLVEVQLYVTKRTRLNLSLLAMTVVTGMLVVVSKVLPAAMGSPANPVVTPLPIFSDWYFLAIYQFFKYLPPYWGVVGVTVIPLIAMVMPWFDRRKERRLRDRPLITVVGGIGLVYWIVFSCLIIFDIANFKRDPPIILAITLGLLAIGAIFEVRGWWKRKRAAVAAGS